MQIQIIREKLKRKKVGIAGCGGLGSNAAVSLARAGVKSFVLVDFDVVDESNLNRQFYFRHQIGLPKIDALKSNMLLIDPTLQVEVLLEKLNQDSMLKHFATCDLIIEAFDQATAKQLMLEAFLAAKTKQYLIMGNGMAGYGGFDKLRQEQWDDKVYICGDFENEISAEMPPLGPRVGIVAHMQANIALELLLKNEQKWT